MYLMIFLNRIALVLIEECKQKKLHSWTSSNEKKVEYDNLFIHSRNLIDLLKPTIFTSMVAAWWFFALFQVDKTQDMCSNTDLATGNVFNNNFYLDRSTLHFISFSDLLQILIIFELRE